MSSYNSIYETIPRLRDKDPKIRLVAIENLYEYLNSNQNEIFDLVSLCDNLTLCLKDSNNRIILISLGCFSLIASILPKLNKSQITAIVSAVISCFGNTKIEVRESALAGILVLMQHYSNENIFTIFLNSVKQINPLIRLGCLSCIISVLKMFILPQETIFNQIVPILIDVLNDKSSEVRETTLIAIAEVYKVTGDTLIEELKKRKMSLLYLKLICDRLSIPDFETKFLGSSSSTKVLHTANLLKNKSTGSLLSPVVLNVNTQHVESVEDQSEVLSISPIMKKSTTPKLNSPKGRVSFSSSKLNSVATPKSLINSSSSNIELNMNTPSKNEQLNKSLSKSNSTVGFDLQNNSNTNSEPPAQKSSRASSVTNSRRSLSVSSLNEITKNINNVSIPLSSPREDDGLDTSSQSISNIEFERELLSQPEPNAILFAVSLKPKPIYSEREFEVEMKKITSTLKDDRTAQWNQRVMAMQNLCCYVAGGAVQLNNFDTLISTIRDPLCNQIQDLRSAVVKEACATVCYLARVLRQSCPSWLSVCEELIYSLFKQIIKSHTVIFSESANSTIRCILRYSPASRYVPKVCTAAYDRSNQLRVRIGEYILLVLHRFDNSIIERYASAIEESIETLVNDKNEETRSIARSCFWAYYNLFSTRGTRILNNFNSAVQRTLIAARDSYVLSPKEYLPVGMCETPSALLSASCPTLGGPSAEFNPGQEYGVKINNNFKKSVKPVGSSTKNSERRYSKSTKNVPEDPVVVVTSSLPSTSFDSAANISANYSFDQYTDSEPSSPKFAPNTGSLPDLESELINSRSYDLNSEDSYVPSSVPIASTNSQAKNNSNSSISAAINASISRVALKNNNSRLKSAPQRVPVAFKQNAPSIYNANEITDDVEAELPASTSKPYLTVPADKRSDFSSLLTLDPNLSIIPELDINIIIKKGKDSNWEERVSSFELFDSMLSAVYSYKIHVDECRDNNQQWQTDDKAQSVVAKLADSLDKLIIYFEDRLNDKHQKVCLACLDFLNHFLTILTPHMLRYLDKIVPILLARLNDPLENIRKASNDLLNLCCKLYAGHELFPAVLRAIDAPSIKTKSGCLECMIHLAENSNQYFSSALNMKQILAKISPLVFEPRYSSLRKLAGTLYKFLFDNHQYVFFAQFILLPSIWQYNLQNTLTISIIAEFSRNLLLFKQNGPKFATLSNIVKSNSINNLKATISTPNIAAIDYPTSVESTLDELSLSDSRNLQSSPVSHLNSRYSSRAASPYKDIPNDIQNNAAFENYLEAKSVSIIESSSSKFLSPSPKTLYDANLYHSPDPVIPGSPKNISPQINLTPIPSVVQPLKSSFLSTRTPVRMSFSSIPTSISASTLSPNNNSNFTPAKPSHAVVTAPRSPVQEQAISNPHINNFGDSFSLLDLLDSISYDNENDSATRLQGLRKLLQLLKQPSYHAILAQNFNSILPIIFNCFADQHIQVRDVSFLILSVLVQSFGSLLRGFTNAIIYLFLQLYKNESREIREVSVDSIMSTVPILESSICYKRLIPLLYEENVPTSIQILLRLFSRIIANDTKESLATDLEEFLPIFSHLIKNDNPDVRKNAVFCMVELLCHFGDNLDSRLTSYLTPTESRLVRIYYNKSIESRKK